MNVKKPRKTAGVVTRATSTVGVEQRRLATLHRLALLDTPDEAIFDNVTKFLAQLFDVPIALITLIDEARQWFKSRYGTDIRESARELAFCDHAIRGDGVMIVPDTTLDARFETNVFVTGEPGIRFYAGAPLVASDGTKLGTVCVLDRVPRMLDRTQTQLLEQMSVFVMAHFEMRLEMIKNRELASELAAVIDASPSAVIIGRIDGTITGWNDAARRLFGWTRDEVLGTRHSFVPETFEPTAQKIRTRVIEGGEVIANMRTTGLHKSGAELEVSFTAKPIYDAAGRPIAAAYVVEDLAAINRARRIERRRFELLELAANDAPVDVILKRLVENVEYSIVDSMVTIARLRGNRLFHAASGLDLPDSFVAAIEGLAIGPAEGSCGSAAFRGETVIVADIERDPLWTAYRATASAAGLRSCWSTPIRSAHNSVLGTLAVYTRAVREPTPAELRFLHEAAHVASIAMEAHDARARLEDMALRDALTELPNRQAFERLLLEAIDRAHLRGRSIALGLLDLNRFKIVNDSLGHAAGDRMLKEIATRLQRSMRPQDVLARMGSDEFLFLLTDVESRSAAETIARRLSATLDESFTPDEHEVFVRASIGISMYPSDSREPSQLIHLADAAMYAAKSSGDCIAFHTGPQRRDGLTRLMLEANLNHALANGEFELYYQPQITLATGAVHGAEALIRWHHPKLGLVMPDMFIKLAEETGLIISIGAWVVREACRFGRRWLDAGGPGVVSVNVSPRQFESDDFVETVVAALSESELPPANLWLEITESLIMRSPEAAAAMLADLRALGVRSSIDDFGTGYSNLNHLRRFPVDGLKIDQTFLRDIGGPLKAGNDVALIRAILGVGRAMNLSIVAEGVESQAQHDFLIKHECAIAQGFLFSKAIPEREIVGWSPKVAG